MKTANKAKVKPQIVSLMVKYYGTIEKARQAYSELKAQKKDVQVLWVALNGKICLKNGNEIFYKGSPDARFVLPS